MKNKLKVLLIFLLFFSMAGYSQLENLPYVGSGYGVLKGTTVTVDSLVFQNNHTLLLQDNSILIINDKVIGNPIFTYGDVGDNVPNSELVPLPQTLNGVPYTDYRESTDVNPQLIFNKCVDQSTFTVGPYIDVQIPIAPTVVITSPITELSCLNPEIILSSTVTSENSLTYLWSTGETTQSITVSPSVTQTYNYTVTNGSCSADGSLVVTVYSIPVADAGLDETIYLGETRVLTASGGSSYLWSTGETTESITVTPDATTTYTVTATNGNLCSSNAQITLTVIEPPTAIANAGNDITIMRGSNVVLKAVGVPTSTYLWSTGETTQSITVSPTQHTIYTVTITEYGSSDTDSVVVRVNQ